MTITMMVNAAWPATNPIALAAYVAKKTATGSAIHIRTVSVPAAAAKRPPRTNPMTLPISASTVDRPVPSALDLSTESVPSTTQNAWPRPSALASRTDRARPTASRMLWWRTVEFGSR